MHAGSSSSSRLTYPPWHRPSQAPTPVAPRFTPTPILHPPPSVAQSPRSLPGRPPLPPPPRGYRSTRHIIPAAWPRQYKEITGNLDRSSRPFTLAPIPRDETKDQRKARNLGEAKESIRQRFSATEWTEEEIRAGKPGMLYIGAEVWKRDGADGKGLVLVMAHANGFTKESWMPTIRHLLKHGPLHPSSTFGVTSSTSKSPSTKPRAIDEIWFLDDIHHGESIDLNAGRVGSIHSWSDGGRDIVNLVENVLPYADLAHSGLVERKDVSHQPLGNKRRVIGIGHSVGGNAMAQAAHFRPDLFEALFLVEPMTVPSIWTHADVVAPDWAKRFSRAVLSIRRRTSWPSFEAAAEVRSTPFFVGWDQEVFHLWMSHGLVPVSEGKGGSGSSSAGGPASGVALVDGARAGAEAGAGVEAKTKTAQGVNRDTDGAVELATPSWAETAVFTESTGIAQGWDALPLLHTRTGFIMSHKADAISEQVSAELVWRPKLARNERIRDSSHLVVQEKPEELGEALWRFLGGIVGGQDFSRDGFVGDEDGGNRERGAKL